MTSRRGGAVRDAAASLADRNRQQVVAVLERAAATWGRASAHPSNRLRRHAALLLLRHPLVGCREIELTEPLLDGSHHRELSEPLGHRTEPSRCEDLAATVLAHGFPNSERRH